MILVFSLMVAPMALQGCLKCGLKGISAGFWKVVLNERCLHISLTQDYEN